MKMALLDQIASYAISLDSNSILPEVKKKGRAFFADGLACIIAGAHGEPSQIAIKYSDRMYGDGVQSATVIGTDKRRNVCSAAFINGISSHFHDYDDVMPAMSGHPSAVVVPTVLALAEELDCSGEKALCAYIAGLEVIDVISRGINQEGQVHYSKGWHATQTLGIFGATAAASLLLGLDAKQMVYALSMAASESSGLKGNFGTMTKAFHAGRAAEKGILVAKLAQDNFTANPDILGMPDGFALTTTGGIHSQAILDRIASRKSTFLDPGMIMKPYPCCQCNHTIIDAIWNLMAAYKFSAADVKKVWIGVQPVFFGSLRYSIARTMLEGKFSANYNAALVLLHERRPRIADYEGEIGDPKIIDAMHKVEMVVDDSIAGGAYSNGSYDTKLEITLHDGRILKKFISHSRGDTRNPLSAEEMREKLQDCMRITLYEDRLEPIISMLEKLEALQSIRILTEAIFSAAKPFPSGI